MTRPTRTNEDLDDLGPDLEVLAARYEADAGGIEAPQHLDAQLLAAAHRAADAKPRIPGTALSAHPAWMRRMRAPLGLAASIVAVASITIVLWKESPEKLAIPSDHPLAVAPTRAPPAADSSSPNNPPVSVSLAPAALPRPALSAPAPALSIIPAPARQRAKQDSGEVQSSRASAAASAARAAEETPKAAQFNEGKPAGIASAAPAPIPRDAEQSLDRVTVTGSNLRRADTETPSPVQVITLDEPAASSASPPAPSTSAKAVMAAQPDAVTATATPPPAVALATQAPAAMLPPAPASAVSVAPPAPAAAPPAVAFSAPAPPPPPISARQVEPASPSAPTIAFSAPAVPAPSVTLAESAAPSIAAPAARAPNLSRAAVAPIEGPDALIAALQTAADAGDAAAVRIVLETLKKNYPHAVIPAKLRAELHRLGVPLPKTR